MSLKKLHRQVEAGSITVFLSLILLLILSLIFTVIEGARVSTAKGYAERSLSTAMDSVLAEYYGPLWEEYHVFGYYPGEGSGQERQNQIITKMKNYISYTLEPGNGLDNSDIGKYNELFDISLDSITIDEDTSLLDYQGQLLVNEAVEYMKYSEMGDGFEKLLDHLSLMETPEKVSYVYEQKQSAEEKLVEIDKGILKLMKLLDGLMTSKKGIKVTKNGVLKTADYFVKKICFGKVTKETVGINQDNVFDALKSCYVNPSNDFKVIDTSFTSLGEVLKDLEDIQTEKASAQTSKSEGQVKSEKQQVQESKTEKGKKQTKVLEGTGNNQKADIKTLEDKEAKQQKIKKDLISDIQKSKDNILSLTKGIEPTIDDAISSIDNILDKTKIAEPLINQYEKILKKQKGSINKETYEGLEENLTEMKKYIASGEGGYDFAGMKVILQKDRIILEKVESLINQGKDELSQGKYDNSKRTFSDAAAEMKKYQTSKLTLDYSTIVIDKSSKNDPLSEVSNLLQSGIGSLVMDQDKLSNRKLTQDTLPSDIAAMAQQDTDFLSKLKTFFKNASIGDSNLNTGSLFESFGDGSQIMDLAGKGINKAAELFLYQEYLKEHFGMYTADGETANRKPSALAYEQEYLLIGKSADRENLSSVVSRIVFLRTILDFASILGDSARRNEARLAAVALVGFTGLPFLVGITQGLILLCWSLAEALLDACTLMMGKKVPVLKKKVVLQLPEIFMINRKFLQLKAREVTGKNEVSFSYQDYLRIFLLLKNKTDLAYRSMDLMQENIKLRYDVGKFCIGNCMFGYKVSAQFSIPPKFIGVSYVKNFLNINPKGFSYSAKAADSY